MPPILAASLRSFPARIAANDRSRRLWFEYPSTAWPGAEAPRPKNPLPTSPQIAWLHPPCPLKSASPPFGNLLYKSANRAFGINNCISAIILRGHRWFILLRGFAQVRSRSRWPDDLLLVQALKPASAVIRTARRPVSVCGSTCVRRSFLAICDGPVPINDLAASIHGPRIAKAVEPSRQRLCGG